MKNKHIESIKKKLSGKYNQSDEDFLKSLDEAKNKLLDEYDLSDLYHVYICQDDRYDNNFFVRAPNKKTAWEIADSYIDNDEGRESEKNVVKITSDEDQLDSLVEYFYDDDAEIIDLLEGKIDCYYYDSGT